jgi:hypothetical protein
MHVLTATSTTQGLDKTDLFEAIEDELVIVEHCYVCDPNKVMFKGVTSGGLTSTAHVTELSEMDLDTYVDILMTKYQEETYLDDLNREQRDVDIDALHQEVIRVIALVESMPAGSLLRREGNDFYAKAWDQAA